MSDKLKSRKLWVALGGLFTVIATEWVGVDPSVSQQIIDAMVIIIPSYIGGQSVVDAMAAYMNGPK